MDGYSWSQSHFFPPNSVLLVSYLKVLIVVITPRAFSPKALENSP